MNEIKIVPIGKMSAYPDSVYNIEHRSHLGPLNVSGFFCGFRIEHGHLASAGHGEEAVGRWARLGQPDTVHACNREKNKDINAT